MAEAVAAQALADVGGDPQQALEGMARAGDVQVFRADAEGHRAAGCQLAGA